MATVATQLQPTVSTTPTSSNTVETSGSARHRPDHYPLPNPERGTITCAVELTGYEPVSMGRIEQLVARDEWQATR